MLARGPTMIILPILLYWITLGPVVVVVAAVAVGHELAGTDVGAKPGSDGSIWKAIQDICHKGEDMMPFYPSSLNQPCEMAYFRNVRAIGVQSNYNESECYEKAGTKAATAAETTQIGDSFPYWNTMEWGGNRTYDFKWWPDICIGFSRRCYSLGKEAIYEKVRTMHSEGLIPPIPQIATHIRVDCTEDLVISANSIARIIPVGQLLLEKILPLIFLSFFFSMIGCTCWSCFCCCWCIRRGQLKQQQKRDQTKRRDYFVAVDPDEVNNME